VDVIVLVIPAAILLFLVRTLMIARSLKAAAANPTLADIRAFRAAKRSLEAHHDRLDEALAEPGNHLAAAKRLATIPKARVSTHTIRPPEGGLLVDRRP
jgi:hypothetical protein